MYNLLLCMSHHCLTHQCFSVNTDGVIGFLDTPCIFVRSFSIRDFSSSWKVMSSIINKKKVTDIIVGILHFDVYNSISINILRPTFVSFRWNQK